MRSPPDSITRFSVTATLCILISATLACSDTGMKKTTDTSSSELTKKMLEKINTETDPAFIYDFEQTKFVPPAGKTLLIMGQDQKTIAEYNDNFDGRPSPSGWTAYWGITSMYGVDRDSTRDVGEKFGYHNHQALVDEFPDTVLQSGLWMAGMLGILDRASKGEFNNVIYQFSTWAKTIERPIYLRIGYEFDGKHNTMDPVKYVKTYRKIVDILRSEDVNNIAFVWQSYAAPTYKGYPVADWYPGDDYVDWVGISLFDHMYSSELNKEADEIFNFARAHKKPVMIAEASPVKGIDKNSIAAWDTWFANFLSLSYRKNVKAISFINADWSSYPGFTELQWKNAQLQNNSSIADAWFEEMEKDRYLKQSPDLFKQLGYKK